MEPELAWENYLLRPWLEQLCYEFHRQGFRAILIVTGHYGHNQQIVVREVGARMTERLQIPVLGTPEYWLAHDEGYLGDHAGIGETSLLWHLHPELVDIARIRQDPEYGATDTIEQGASPELGQRYADTIIARLAILARAMPSWDPVRRNAFVRAERALLTAQVSRLAQRGPLGGLEGAAAAGIDAVRHPAGRGAFRGDRGNGIPPNEQLKSPASVVRIIKLICLR